MTDLQRARRYWRIALTFPALGCAAGFALDRMGIPVRGIAVGIVIGFVIIAVPYLPYAFVMAWLYGRAKSADGVVARAALWPLVFMPIYAACAVALLLVLRDGPIGPNDVPGVLSLAGIVLLFGYGYFIASLIGYLVLETVVRLNRPPHDTSHFESHPREE